MDPWRRSSLTQNPYYRTAFRVAGIPREIASRRALVQLISQTRQIVSTDKAAHPIDGVPVSEAEINWAEAVLLDPRQRIVEELLSHAAERAPLEPLRKLSKEISSVMASEDVDRAPVENLIGLEGWADSLVRHYLARAQSPPPSLGALELELVPPFGRPEER